MSLFALLDRRAAGPPRLKSACVRNATTGWPAWATRALQCECSAYWRTVDVFTQPRPQPAVPVKVDFLLSPWLRPMPTPALYSRYATSSASFWREHRWPLVFALVALSFTPAVLERLAPSVGPAPGRALFVFMLAYFAAVMPLLVFRRPLPAKPWPNGVALWAWARSTICTAWIALCIWFIWSAFDR